MVHRSETGVDAMSRVKLRDVFGIGFWINYAVTIVITLWIPIAHLVFKTEDGQIVRETYPAVYTLYLDILRQPDNLMIYRYIALHLGLTFAVTALVWFVVAWYSSRGASASKEA